MIKWELVGGNGKVDSFFVKNWKSTRRAVLWDALKFNFKIRVDKVYLMSFCFVRGGLMHYLCADFMRSLVSKG